MGESRNPLFGLGGDAREELVRRMVERRAGRPSAVGDDDGGPGGEGPGAAVPVEGAAAPRPAAAGAVSEEFRRLDRLPGIRELAVQHQVAAGLGLEIPFFRLHERVARDTALIGGREYLNFASYNYLDCCGHPAVAVAAREAIERYGTSASASRPVSGERPPQRDLERALAALHETEDCAVFVSGWATNVTVLGHLFGARDLIVHDARIHNSALQGARLSGARRLPFAHNDLDALDRLLAGERPRAERTVILVEGIYSMDGDLPDLERLIEIKRRHAAFLMVDEAHSIGVLGARGFGLGEHFGVARGEVDLWMGTLSKTLASCGGYIAGARTVIEYLKHTAPGFLYSVGIAPPMAAAALAALELMKAEPERVARLRERGRLFLDLAKRAGLDTGQSAGYSVVPVIVGSSLQSVRLSSALFEHGVNVQPIIHPAVEERAARLRFFICCSHTEEQIRHTVELTARELARLAG